MPRGRPGIYGRMALTHCDCLADGPIGLLGDWPAVSAAGRRQPVAGDGRGMVAGRFVRDVWDVLFHADAHVEGRDIPSR